LNIDVVNTGSGTTELDSSGTAAFFGVATSTTGSGTGVWGKSNSPTGIGVDGWASHPTGSNRGVFGHTDSTSGVGVDGFAGASSGNTIGVFGHSDSTSGIGVLGLVGATSAIPIIARGVDMQTANLQEWQKSDWTPLSAINKDGWLGIGTSNPERSIHLKGNNAVFRMDRDVNSSAFILVRTSPAFSSIWKTFYVGVDATGVNNGEFFIGDVGDQVSGPSTKRLWIDNSGQVHIPNLGTGDINFANGVVATQEGDGLAFVNRKGKKIAVLDDEGNLQVKGKLTENPNL
jgi:hypothetical protein